MNPFLQQQAANLYASDSQAHILMDRLTFKANHNGMQFNDPDAVMFLHVLSRYIPSTNNGSNYQFAMAQFNNFAMHTGPQGWNFDNTDNLFTATDIIGSLEFGQQAQQVQQALAQQQQA